MPHIAHFTLTGIFLSCILLSGYNHTLAQEVKLSKSARRAAEKAEQKQKDKIAFQEVLLAFKNDQWAFETPQMVDNMGLPIPDQHRPNVVGYDGHTLDAFVVWRHETKSLYQDQPDVQYFPQHYEGQVTKKEEKTDKKGRLIYKYTVAPPFGGEVTVMLYPNTPKGTVILNTRQGSSVTYLGKFMPIRECWYYIEVERKQKKK